MEVLFKFLYHDKLMIATEISKPPSLRESPDRFGGSDSVIFQLRPLVRRVESKRDGFITCLHNIFCTVSVA